MLKRDEILRLFDLADRKGYRVVKAILRDHIKALMRDHVRLIDGEGNLVKNRKGGAAHSYAEARQHLESLPDRRG